MNTETDTTPLCIDLDGTLVRSDTLVESLLVVLKQRPWLVLLLPLWLLRGKAELKRQIAARAELDPGTLPYHTDLVDWLRTQAAAGRKIYLATAADQKIAKSVADHLGLFDGVLASGNGHNLKGKNKQAALQQEFGSGGYDYAGNDTADLAIWADCRQADR